MTETSAELPAWQKGYPIEQLKALAEPFRRHKPLVFGAFGLTKERDVADALAAGRLIWTGKPPQACAIAHVTARGTDGHDFAQRPYALPDGVVLVKAFAALDLESGIKVLQAVKSRSENRTVVAELFQEDELSRKCAEALGFALAATKISAGSEIKGVYCDAPIITLPPLAAEDQATLEVLDPGFVPAEQLAEIERELDTFGATLFAQHYSDYNKRKSWTSFALRGYADDPTFIIKPAEMSKSWKEEHPREMAEKVRWTSAAPSFPATLDVLKRLGLELDRARFMRLRSKDGELSRHADITDREAGTADGFVSRLHIPIRTSDAVTFYGWTALGEKIERTLPRGALCYLDQRKPHAVKNQDPALDRVHLVVDCFANAALRKLIAGSQLLRPFPAVAAA